MKSRGRLETTTMSTGPMARLSGPRSQRFGQTEQGVRMAAMVGEALEGKSLEGS